MRLEYLDLLIIHALQPWGKWRKKERFFEENREVWRALEDAYKEKNVRAIGVSNFLVDDLQNIIDHCEIKPMVNQVLCHVGNTPTKLIDFCQKEGIIVEAYSPNAHGKVLKNKELKAIADKYNVSISQLCIRYDVELNAVVLPKTANKEHMISNATVDFTISDEDMKTLKNINSIKYGMLKMFPVYSGK